MQFFENNIDKFYFLFIIHYIPLYVCYTRLLLLPPPIQKWESAEKARPLNSILELQFLGWVCFNLYMFSC